MFTEVAHGGDGIGAAYARRWTAINTLVPDIIYDPIHGLWIRYAKEEAMDIRERKIVDDRLSPEPEIGRWLWALQDARQRTMDYLDGLTQAVIDWVPPDNGSSIGTVLYHIASIEVDWLYIEVLEQAYPPEVAALFPYADRDGQGHLTQIQGARLDQHLERLETVRQLVLTVFQQMSLQEFRRVRSLPAYDVTPEWVLHHLMQHEAEHRSQMGALRAAAERALVPV